MTEMTNPPESVTLSGWAGPRAMASWHYAYDSGLLHYLDMIINDSADTMTFNVATPVPDDLRLIWLDISNPDARHDKFIRHPGRRELARKFRESLSIPF